MRPLLPSQVPTTWCHCPGVSDAFELKLLQLLPPKFTRSSTMRMLIPLRQPPAGCALIATVWVPA